MELKFEKIGKKWVAEFEATGNFNLNIERVAPEKIQVFQKGAEDGEYASQASWYNNYASAIVDYDFSALIYPKWIKVVSYSEPIQAIVTMEGESGGSGSGGLRLFNADDVKEILFMNSKADIESHNYWGDKYIIMPAGYSTVVRFKSTEKNVFIGNKNGNEFTIFFQIDGSILFQNNTAFDKTLYLDLYIQD